MRSVADGLQVVNSIDVEYRQLQADNGRDGHVESGRLRVQLLAAEDSALQRRRG